MNVVQQHDILGIWLAFVKLLTTMTMIKDAVVDEWL